MNGVCPTCGASGSLEFFLSEAVARQAMAEALKLPKVVQDQLLPYLALFRPAAGAMQSRKALRLIKEAAALVATGHCQTQGKPSRPCPPRIWAEGMAQMTERRGQLTLPLKNHSYLVKVAWGLADADDARAEAQRNSDALSGNHRRPSPLPLSPGERENYQLPQGEDQGEGEDDGLLPIERRLLAAGKPIMKRIE